MKIFFSTLSVLFILSLFASGAYAHCQVPCGIYGDEMRVNQITEDIKTVEKAMNQITALSKNMQSPINYNQLVRWVNTKEEHASRIMDTISKYFMAQRITPDQNHYRDKLTALHKLMLSAMKSKQTVDLKNVKDMRTLLEEFNKLYFKEHSH